MICISSTRATGHDLVGCATWTSTRFMSTAGELVFIHQGVTLRAYLRMTISNIAIFLISIVIFNI